MAGAESPPEGTTEGDSSPSPSLSSSYEAVPLHSDDRKIVRSIEKDPWNRLHSIVEDSQWVADVSRRIPHLPVIANLRCGAWYVPQRLLPPDSAASTFCYFKSTDGHANEWNFSLKRPNLGVLQLIQERGGVIIVDSTRRGKSLPDALSKAIPIWCAVLTEASARIHGQPSGRAVLDATAQDPFRASNHGRTALATPSHQVPPSEHAQMEERMQKWVVALISSDLPVPRLQKPIVPFFLTRPSNCADTSALLERLSQVPASKDVHPVILLSASRRVDLPTPSASGRYYYTQGSGDDEELWSHGLCPNIFWSAEHHNRLMSTPYARFSDALREVVQASVRRPQEESEAVNSDELHRASDTEIGSTGLFIGKRPSWHTFTTQELEQYGLIVHCDAPMPEAVPGGCGATSENMTPPSQISCGLEQTLDNLSIGQTRRALVLHLDIPAGKKGLTTFRGHLPAVLQAAEKILLPASDVTAATDSPGGATSSTSVPARILLVDSTLKDLAVSFCTAILARFFSSPRGPAVRSTTLALSLSKEEIRKRLQWIAQSLPEANPSRGHMLRINEVLLSPSMAERGSDGAGPV